MPIEPGSKVGPYEIIAPLPAWPITESFKASDTRAKRTVSLSALPPELTNADRWEQFERETKTISSLNHPHISPLVDVVRVDGAVYVVTEYFEGETLASRLKRGPLEVDEALKIAIAAADALDKAHRSGVVHRALSPSSIMLTPKGTKIVGFGVSGLKPIQTPGPVSELPTRTTAFSATAVPAGAARYLAPELFEGREATSKTDIFALGAILYEMVTGRPAFEGKTQALLVAAITTANPDPASKIDPAVPAEIDYVITRCLAKDPAQRMQTAWDMLCQLQWIVEGGSQIGLSVPAAALRRKRERAVRIAIVAALLLAVVLAIPAFVYMRGSAQPEEVRFNLANIGEAGGGVGVTSPWISPNGRFVSASRGTRPGLDLIPLGSGAPQILAPENTIWLHFWSPDSRTVGFWENGYLKKADVSGGPTQNICEVAAPFGGATWSKEGVIVYASGGLLYKVLAAGGQPAQISELNTTEQETEHFSPSFLPDGRHYLYLAISSKPSNDAIYVASIDSKDRKRLFAASARAIYAAPGYVLFNRGTAVFAQPFDPDKLSLSGEAIRIADGVPPVVAARGAPISPSAGRNAAFAVSQAGVLLYRTGANPQAPPTSISTLNSAAVGTTLTWLDRSGRRTGQVGNSGFYFGVDLSPDGKQIAVHRHENDGGDNWILDAAQGRLQRLTFDTTQENAMPVWSPDGKRIAFASRRNGKFGIYVKLADGTASEELIIESDLNKIPLSWSPDGKLLVYWVADPKTRGDIWAVPLAGDRKPVPIVNSPSNELAGQVSADGKWIAYQSDETGRNEIYIKPFPSGAGKWQVSTELGTVPRWRRDGKELFFMQAPSIMSVDVVVEGASVKTGTPRVLFGFGNPAAGPHTTGPSLVYAVSADGQRFLIPQLGVGASAFGGISDFILSLSENPQTNTINANATTVVLNWPRMLKK